MRVLIIGGGIGGLCLAHGLHKVGIDVVVFERNVATADALPGFGIHLDRRGCEALSACLPEENWRMFDASAGDAGSISRFYDEQLGVLSERDDAATANAQASVVGERRSIGRLRLREILLHGLTRATHGDADIVVFGKQFMSYEALADGRLRACFADGDSMVGDVLIGADGSNSRVRKQRFPDLSRVDTEVLNIAGRYRLTAERETRLPAALIDGAPNSIVPRGLGWLFVSAWREPHGKHAGRDYVVWAFSDARRNYPDGVSDWDAAALRDYVSGRIASWAPELRTLVRDADLETIAPIPLRTMPPLQDWQAQTVTLLGDAIHNMTPMAGIGANTALRDAGNLMRALYAAATGGDSLVHAIGAYETEMRVYANKAVALSTRNALIAGSIHAAQRALFRSMMVLRRAAPRALIAALPTLAFVFFNYIHSLAAGSIAAIVAAIATLAWSSFRPDTRKSAFVGLLLGTLGAAIAARTGEARSFFLVPVFLPLAIIGLCVATVLRRRPLAGLLLNRLAGGPANWHKDVRLRRIYTIATLMAAGLNLVNFSVQWFLYYRSETAWLAATHILSGPLWSVLVAATVVAARRALRCDARVRDVAIHRRIPG